MFNWFKSKDIDLVRLDEDGWRLREKSSELKVWENSSGDVLSLNFFDKEPDIPFALSEIDGLRKFYRNLIAESGGGILKLETVELGGLTAIETLCKLPKQPSGMIYVGSLTIPFREKSYVVKLQCTEQGITGMREAVFFASRAHFDEDGEEDFDPFKGWAKDPYDETFTDGVLMNLSEDEQYDEKFPNHPLSRVRRYLKEIKQTISFDEKLFDLPKFAQ